MKGCATPRITYRRLPVFVLDVSKAQTKLDSVDAFVAHFRRRIAAHRCAKFIAVFDQYAHTATLPEGEIADGIRAAKNVVFCFGMSIPDPAILALRPRSIGIVELDDRFVISFMETPMPLANAAMESWTLETLNPRRPNPTIVGGVKRGRRYEESRR